jgi:hypothetical protein
MRRRAGPRDAALERQLTRGDKALVGNSGYRRFLKTVGDGHFVIDRGKVAEDARFDGVFVLRTNTDLNPLAAMLRYKQLWTVERIFRTDKHLFATRPIFHKLDETIRGHVFCSFLALVLKIELEQRPHFANPGGALVFLVACSHCLCYAAAVRVFLPHSASPASAGLFLAYKPYCISAFSNALRRMR